MASIGYIFVLGYFASASVGTYVSSLGDRYGYRRFVILYGTAYGIACLLMRSSNLVILLASRVASGVAYSLLFSSFESWAITEADRLRLDRRYLVGLFSTATFFNACSAVAAGVVGNLVVDFSRPVTFGNDPGSGIGTRTDVGEGWDDVADVVDVATLAADYESGTGGGSALDREPSTLLFPRNRYTPAFDVGAGVLFLCALGAYKLWWEGGVGGRNVQPQHGGAGDAERGSGRPRGRDDDGGEGGERGGGREGGRLPSGAYFARRRWSSPSPSS